MRGTSAEKPGRHSAREERGSRTPDTVTHRALACKSVPLFLGDGQRDPFQPRLQDVLVAVGKSPAAEPE